MSEIQHPVKIVLVEMICDSCKEGMMCYDLASLPGQPHYEHICNSCGAKKVYDDRYPYLSYRFDDDYEINRQAYQYV